MTPEEARGYIDGLSFGSKLDVWVEFPNRYDHWDAFDAFATVAGLRYEYAVQVPHPLGVWSYIIIDRETYEHSITPHPHWADWENNLDDAKCVAESLERARVVRRLVSEPEVAE